MAEKEVKEAPKKEAPKKEKKPSIFSRFGAWLKSCKSEMKKVVWASWSSVKSNTLMVLACIVVVSAVIGLVDYLFSQGFTILGKLI
ncbi:MAG: preprotein translocase subunit SecE [Clostridia bacterium]|nr:preprotein translocase subunit SecE [Clostridia bacterium]